MLNVSFIFEDAKAAMSEYADRLAVAPLPAAVYMMQVDVLNHYRYALTHYFTLTLGEPILQDSSLGTPYQKWAFFVNKNFAMLSFAVHHLLDRQVRGTPAGKPPSPRRGLWRWLRVARYTRKAAPAA